MRIGEIWEDIYHYELDEEDRLSDPRIKITGFVKSEDDFYKFKQTSNHHKSFDTDAYLNYYFKRIIKKNYFVRFIWIESKKEAIMNRTLFLSLFKRIS